MFGSLIKSFYLYIINLNQMNLKVLKLNLQQTIIYEDVQPNVIAICAIHDNHKKLLAVHTNYSSMTNEIEDFLKTTDLKYSGITWGDGFHCDTWDDKIKEFSN
jgi:hypothetical protein